MSLVREVCACCGEKTAVLAVIMDPFTDSCYGVCRTCMGPLYEKQMIQFRESISGADREPE